MIQPQTWLRIADNSGGKTLMCIRVLSSSKRYGQVGDVIVGVVKDSYPKEVVQAVIVRTKHPILRKDGTRLQFETNSCVIVTKEQNPRGTRIFGSIAREIKNKGFSKIASLAPELV
tara:strand:+ start:767 stop:1114 length:348 start_codon:yes stop_codon:yes gene_type:complete